MNDIFAEIIALREEVARLRERVAVLESQRWPFWTPNPDKTPPFTVPKQAPPPQPIFLPDNTGSRT